MATSPNTAVPSGCPTIIETLHAAYVRSYEAYNVNDAADCMCRGESPKTQTLRNAMTELHKQSELLTVAILREMPTTPQDAMIVAYHAANATDMISSYDLKEVNSETGALNVMMQNLLVYLTRQEGASIAPGGWFAKQMEYAFANVGARTAPMREAA